MPNAIRTVSGWGRTGAATVAPAATPQRPSPPRNGIRSASGWQPGPLPPAEPEPAPVSLSAAARIDEVLAWVDGDPQRADEAWCVEVLGKRRPTLLRTLAVIADGPVDSGTVAA